MRGKLLGAGGDGIDTELLTASPDEVLDGQIFYGEGSEEMQTGTMPDRPAVDTAPGIVGLGDLLKVYLYRGGHIRNGASGYPEVNIPYPDLVNAINLAAEVIRNGVTIAGVTGTYCHDGNLTKDKLVAGQVGYGANGRVAGEAVDRGAVNRTLAAGESYSIQKGFYENGSVAAKDLASQTGGTAGAGDVLKNKTAWVNGSKVTGNIESKGEEVFYVNPDDRAIPAARYTSGVQTIKGVKTENISAGNIKKGVRMRVGDENNLGRIADVTGTLEQGITLNGWWTCGTLNMSVQWGRTIAVYNSFAGDAVYYKNFTSGTMKVYIIRGETSYVEYTIPIFRITSNGVTRDYECTTEDKKALYHGTWEMIYESATIQIGNG